MPPSLDPLRKRIGASPRKVGFFEDSPLDFPVPDWLTGVSAKDDPLKLLVHRMTRLWKRGDVRWGCILRANAGLYETGDDDCPGDILFSVTDDDSAAWAKLQTMRDRLGELKFRPGPPPLDQRELEWKEDIENDMSFHQGFKLPEGWMEAGSEYRASTALFHRGHLPDGKLSHRIFPCLVDQKMPWTVAPIPYKFWPEGFAEELDAALNPPEPDLDPIALQEFYQSIFGSISSVSHELLNPGPGHIDVYRIDANDGRPFQTLITGGMSALGAPGESDGDAWRHELVFYSKQHHPEASDLLRSFARYPAENGVPISPGDTIPLGSHAERVLGSPRFPVLLFLGGVRPVDTGLAGKFRIGDHPVYPLTVVPLTEAEFQFYHASDPTAWHELVKNSEKSILFDPDRQSLV